MFRTADAPSGGGGRRLRVLVAPDKFRGSLTATEAARSAQIGVKRAHPGAEVTLLPIADGGEGSLDACFAAGFVRVSAPATDPLGRPIGSSYARHGETAVVELAQASGLHLYGASPDVARRGSTFGTGLLVRHAIERGARTVVLAVGGSATTDGGVGIACALGVVFRDELGRQIPPSGAEGLRRVRSVDVAAALPLLRQVDLVVAADVDVPLTGPRGAAHQFGPQKGATADDILMVESGLVNLAEVVRDHSGTDPRGLPMAGAAGGVLASLALLGARAVAGADYCLDLLGFDGHVAAHDLVVTGEGKLDEQTLAGKGPGRVARRAADAGLPVLFVAGRSEISDVQSRSAGMTLTRCIADLEADPLLQLSRAAALVEQATWSGTQALLGRRPELRLAGRGG